MRTQAARLERGISTLEVMVALAIVAAVILMSGAASTRLVDMGTSALGMLERGPAGSQKPARLLTVAAMWARSQMEYARQLGFEGECDQASCAWYLAGPSSGLAPGVYADCWGTSVGSANPVIVQAVASSPGLPPDLPFGRLLIGWDPASPTGPGGAPYLQLVEVDAYRTQADCAAGSAVLRVMTDVGR
jgi:hypothetical protein